jgi:hypothetical protein
VGVQRACALEPQMCVGLGLSLAWSPSALRPDAHWSPFQAAAVQYIQSLPTPWTNSTEALVAFFFGVVSHYIADIKCVGWWGGVVWGPPRVW